MRPGVPLLAWGMGVFALVSVFFVVWHLWFPSLASGRGALVLIFGPLLLPFFAAMMVPNIFFIGSITGVPLVSFTAGLGWARRAWRGLLGAVLLLAGAFALVSEFLL